MAYTVGDGRREMRTKESGGYRRDKVCSGKLLGIEGDSTGALSAGDGPVGHTGMCLLGIGLGLRFTFSADGIGDGGGVEWCSVCC
jgi:hypothetical protein